MHLSTRAAILATAEEVLRDEPTRIIVRARSGRILYWHPVDGETWQLAESTGADEPAPRLGIA